MTFIFHFKNAFTGRKERIEIDAPFVTSALIALDEMGYFLSEIEDWYPKGGPCPRQYRQS